MDANGLTRWVSPILVHFIHKVHLVHAFDKGQETQLPNLAYRMDAWATLRIP